MNGFVRYFRRTLVCASACVTAGAFLVPATDSIHGETHRAQELVISEPRINDRIRVPEVRLVGPGGEQVGVVPLKDALRLAEDAELDLVEVAPNAKPPVCKLMDYGKYKYEAAIKARESRKKQANAVLKEIRFRLKIDTHDYETKVGHARRFLSGGDKVKAMIQFRGREQQRPEMCVRLLERLAAEGAPEGGDVTVFMCFDHEEVGSGSRTGAAGPILETVLRRTATALGRDEDGFERMLAASSCVSADAAHSVHPNYAGHHDPDNRPVMGRGPVIKINSKQRYATDGEGIALWNRACAAAGVPSQSFVGNNAMPCGTTIGPITATRLGILTVDVGVGLLSMHSAREMSHIDDLLTLSKALEAYWRGA